MKGLIELTGFELFNLKNKAVTLGKCKFMTQIIRYQINLYQQEPTIEPGKHESIRASHES